MHLLWVLANVWISADTAAVKLVLPASSKDLKVKRLVKVPEVSRREVYSQRHLTVGWHDPPEMIQPAKDHPGFSSENASFMPSEDGMPPGRSPVLLGLGLGATALSPPICCHTLQVGLQHFPPRVAQWPT